MTAKELITFENKLKKLWESGKLQCPIHFCGGNEEELLKIFTKIGEEDYVYSTHRNHYHALLKHVPADLLLAEISGQTSGLCKGRARSMCTISHSDHFYASAIVGGVCAIAVGTAYALKVQGSLAHVYCFVGDGCMDGGHFYETLAYSESQDLPVTFIVEDNDRSTCSTQEDRLGTHLSSVRYAATVSPKVHYYYYKPTYGHVGSGKYVQF